MTGKSSYGSALAVVMALGLIAGCDRNAEVEKIPYEGGYYDARLTAERETPRAFSITVSPVSAGIENALEAGRYEATKYCIRTFGSSKATWVIGPDTPVDRLTVVENTLTLSGTCAR